MAIIHTYFTRAKCQCGYLWTTEPLGNVVCKCGNSGIIGTTISGIAVEVTSEEDFKLAVANDISATLEELTVVAG